MRYLPIAALLALAQAGVEPRPSADAVARAASAYVTRYQEQLTSVVADETYTQSVNRQMPIDQTMPRTRRLTSEVFFMFEPAGTEWLMIRDVTHVDRRAIENRPLVLNELQRLPPAEVVATFKSLNSRFNLGRIYRNFSEPALSLGIFDDSRRDRVMFSLRRIDSTSSGTVAVLSFAETKAPTLIHDPSYGPALSKGEFTVEVGTGRIRRAVLIASVGSLRLELTTTFAEDERLGIWVPTRFQERYEHGVAPKNLDEVTEYEDVGGDARYSNYRRFVTSARIKR